MFIAHQFFPFGVSDILILAVVGPAAMGSVDPLLCAWFGCTSPIHSGAGECKDCDPYGQLLCGMLQVPSAVHTLHTHSMAAHGHSTGAYNTYSHIMAGPVFMLQFGITHWYWLFDGYSLETL